jgi:mRNA interferase RelE/StbE
MGINVVYSVHAHKDLKSLDKSVAKRIILKIKDNADLDDPLTRAKALQGVLADKYRYRIGDYRAIFVIDAHGRVSVLKVLRVKHRKDVYDL